MARDPCGSSRWRPAGRGRRAHPYRRSSPPSAYGLFLRTLRDMIDALAPFRTHLAANGRSSRTKNAYVAIMGSFFSFLKVPMAWAAAPPPGEVEAFLGR